MTVLEQWNTYAKAVNVPEGGVQWRETEQAFYSGILSFMSEMLKIADLPEDDGAKWLEERRNEVQQKMLARIEERVRGKSPEDIVRSAIEESGVIEQFDRNPKVEILQWTPDGAKKPTQVHILIHTPGGPIPVFAVRLKSKNGSMSFMKDLLNQCRAVWPDESEEQ